MRLNSVLLFVPGILFSQSYLWPTNASQKMTSSFCEYRPGHFHAGIDIKTWGREGYPVFAVESGHIARIRVSPYGYGCAVYLRLDNGLTVIYAHLSEFAPRLRERVHRHQTAHQRYQADLRFSSDALRVEKGETLGFTGSTGIGAAHLHFEVRDSLNRPFNPLDLGYHVEDNLPPVIRALSASPLAYGAFVNGDLLPERISVRETGRGVFEADSVISVWGEIGLGVNVFDMADGATNRFAPHRLRLFVGDSLCYTITYGSFSYSETHLIHFDRDYRLRHWGWGNFQKLWLDPRNSVDFYRPKHPGAGRLYCGPLPRAHETGMHLSRGLHRVRIEAEDYRGNTSRTFLFLEVARPQLKAPGLSEYTNHALWDTLPSIRLQTTWLDTYVRFEIQMDSTANHTPGMTLAIGEMEKQIPVFKNRKGQWIGAFPYNQARPGDWILGVHISAIHFPVFQDTLRVLHLRAEGGGNHFSSADGCFGFSYDGDSFYQDYWGMLIREPCRHDNVFGFQYRFVPEDVPLQKPIEVMFYLPCRDSLWQGEAIYCGDVKKRFISDTFIKHERRITGHVASLGPYAVLRDTVPPVIQALRPAPGSLVLTSRPKIMVGFQDTLSGIYGEENYQIFLNGKRMIVAYDPEENVAFSTPDIPLASGFHEAKTVLRDRAGNAVRRKWTFRVQ